MGKGKQQKRRRVFASESVCGCTMLDVVIVVVVFATDGVLWIRKWKGSKLSSHFDSTMGYS